MNTEKKIRRYLRRVSWRLNLPKALKERLVEDLRTSISARMEQGESWESVEASLGTARTVAAGYMVEMQEEAYRKSPWRFLFAAMALYGGGRLLKSVLTQAALLGIFWQIRHQNAASIGIIGGADGPTAVFVTGPVWGWLVLDCLLAAVGIFGYLRLRKCNK